MPIGNTELLLAAVYKSPGKAWRDVDIIELLNFRRKSVLAGGLNARHPFLNSAVSNPQVRNSWSCLILVTLKFQSHKVPLTIPLQGMVMC
jgi:hypothetical protein